MGFAMATQFFGLLGFSVVQNQVLSAEWLKTQHDVIQ
jgi:hypothetical protein